MNKGDPKDEKVVGRLQIRWVQLPSGEMRHEIAAVGLAEQDALWTAAELSRIAQQLTAQGWPYRTGAPGRAPHAPANPWCGPEVAGGASWTILGPDLISAPLQCRSCRRTSRVEITLFGRATSLAVGEAAAHYHCGACRARGPRYVGN